MSEVFDWVRPSLLNEQTGQAFRQPDFFRPTLLEFASDDFMDEFLAAVRLRQTNVLQQAELLPSEPGQVPRLFQPVHGRFYLTCVSLCCRSPGFPDRVIRTQEGESAFFVLRRVIDGVEYGWLTGQAATGWQPLADNPRRVLPDEERHPLTEATTACGRSILFGYIPVASGETHSVTPQTLAIDGDVADPRLEEFDARFGQLLAHPAIFKNVTDDALAISISVYLLLDVWEYLKTVVADVAESVCSTQGDFSGEQAQAKQQLLTFLNEQILKGQVSWAKALCQVASHAAQLNQPGGVPEDQLSPLGFDDNYNLKGVVGQDTLDTLRDRLQAALPPEMPKVDLPKIDTRANTRYVLRCVYERPQCDPTVQVVSLPTGPFVLATFFDPDAPARVVRIPLPTDVSIAGMRKFKKGVSFMMSDGFRRKTESIVGHEKDLITDNPDLQEGDGGLAFVCSFSIQIIFIVAFFLLIIFVFILNIVFWWLAFFKICLPIPKSWLPE